MSISPKRLKEVRDGRPSFSSINPSLIIIPTTISDSLVHAMVDTGATHTLITRSLLHTFSHVQFTKTSSISALLGDTSTAISVQGIAQLYIYVNHIPTYVSAHVVDLILGMDWCRTYDVSLRIHQHELCLRHPHYGSTTVSLLNNVSIPPRLAHSVQLLALLSSALQVVFTLDIQFC
jgi:predicted aspartyl protease